MSMFGRSTSTSFASARFRDCDILWTVTSRLSVLPGKQIYCQSSSPQADLIVNKAWAWTTLGLPSCHDLSPWGSCADGPPESFLIIYHILRFLSHDFPFLLMLCCSVLGTIFLFHWSSLLSCSVLAINTLSVSVDLRSLAILTLLLFGLPTSRGPYKSESHSQTLTVRVIPHRSLRIIQQWSRLLIATWRLEQLVSCHPLDITRDK